MMFLEPLQLPDRVQVDDTTYSDSYGKFEIGPLEKGFATTIGNTLRRVLLSSIQGAAVRFVKIEGLHHEFAPIPGSDSDYIDLILKFSTALLFRLILFSRRRVYSNDASMNFVVIALHLL